MAMPEYTDGVMELYKIEEDETEDYPEEKLRYMGMHIIMLSAALMLILYNWILFKNLRKKVKRSEVQEPQSDEGGFEQIR